VSKTLSTLTTSLFTMSDHQSPAAKRAKVTSKKRVAIFGGSFNPITNAHLNVASEMIHSQRTDEVWLLPCGPRPDKPSLKTSTLDRVIMCHLAVATTFGSRFPISVCSAELSEPKALSSYVMMNRMEKVSFFVLMYDCILI